MIGIDWGFAFEKDQYLLEQFSTIFNVGDNTTKFAHNTVTLLLTYEFIIDSVRNIGKMSKDFVAR